MSLHSRAWCGSCTWTAEGDDADRQAHLHTTSKAKSHVQHATASSTHPKHLCTDECHTKGQR